jgi:hypothetical protein
MQFFGPFLPPVFKWYCIRIAGLRLQNGSNMTVILFKAQNLKWSGIIGWPVWPIIGHLKIGLVWFSDVDCAFLV